MSSDGSSDSGGSKMAMEHHMMIEVGPGKISSFSLSGAILHVTNVALARLPDAPGPGPVVLSVSTPSTESFGVVAYLGRDCPSKMVDLSFFEDDVNVDFKVEGPVGVHITGNVSLDAEQLAMLQAGDEDSDSVFDSEDGLESDEDDEDDEVDKDATTVGGLPRVEEVEEKPTPMSKAERRRAKKAAAKAGTETAEESPKPVSKAEIKRAKQAVIKAAAEAKKAAAEAEKAALAAKKEAEAEAKAKAGKSKRGRDKEGEMGTAKKAREPPAPPSKETRTKEGLKYTDVVTGMGKKPAPGKHVRVHYVGRLANGKIFDRSKSPFKFRLGIGQVIKGWDMGVAGMRVGGKRKLVIPPHLGYGRRGAPPTIPPDATLHFEVELLSIK